MKISIVIIAGGSGSRLWPASRSALPKQFLNIHGPDTMLQSTIKRISGLDIQSSIVVCNDEHRFHVADQLKQLDFQSDIILEPESKGTAPAIALAALALKEDSIMLVLPADHIIKDKNSFIEAVQIAIQIAQSNKLVTFGIVPDKPETGYGYIEAGMKEGNGFVIKKFIEKPKIDDAKDFIKSDNFLWNSGMFAFKASQYIESLKEYSPDIYKSCENSFKESEIDRDFIRVNKEIFSTCPSNSIDYAVMEKISNAVVVPMNAGWSDIGSWSSLWEVSDKDVNGNVLKGDVIAHNSKNNLIQSNDKLVTSVGVNDLVIISEKDSVLIASKDSAQDIRLIPQNLKKTERPEWKFHREVHRPWGKYDSVDSDEGFQVKRISVYPKQKLSVQMHHHRSEHWVVVSGIGRVHYGDEYKDLHVNDSTYHDAKVMHSLENPGDELLILIEIQVGSYLGEDDIVRFSDSYGRK